MNKKIFIKMIDDKVVFLTNNLSYDDFVFENFIEKNQFKSIVLDLKDNTLIIKNNSFDNIAKIITILWKKKEDIDVIIEPKVDKWLKTKKIYLKERSIIGKHIKLNSLNFNLEKLFKDYKLHIEKKFISRPLSNFQLLDSFYLTIMKRSSNFSVPGSGKTTTCLAAYNYLLTNNTISKLVVIGPKSCFKSWRDEYISCFKKEAHCLSVDMLNASTDNERKSHIQMLVDSNSIDIYFYNYESVPKRIEELKKIISHDTLLIFDEVHKIKALNGRWAISCKEIALLAGYRVTLTGTPIPNGYQDIYNILQILYAEEYKEFFQWKYEDLKNNKNLDYNEFKEKIYLFFVRTTKKDLNVPPPNMDNIIEFELSENELKLYEQIMNAYKNNFFALCIRLLQSLSCPISLSKNLEQYQLDEETDEVESNSKNDMDEFNKPIINLKIQDLVNSIEIPTKIKRIIELIRKLKLENKKIILWSIFLEPMYMVENLLKQELSCRIINGKVKQSERDDIINEFQKGDIDLLISNPQTMAESVSIHQHCHDAIYIDFSFNLVYMLQSKDRIHRYGLHNDVETNYYFFIPNNLYKNIDNMIYKRLKEKEKLMLDAINSKDITSINSKQEYTYKEIAEEIAREILGVNRWEGL